MTGDPRTFADKYGPWALIAGASEGLGAALAEAIAARGVDVVLLARRQAVLDEVAAGITERTGARTRTLALDLTDEQAAAEISRRVGDLEIGLLVYCAGADPDFTGFLANSLAAAEVMVQRNCTVPMQLCHHLAPPMVRRGRGGIVIVGSGAGLAGGPDMAAYGASKAFDMVFAEALWAELRDTGVDVVGLILGKTDTPALRRLEHRRGLLTSAAQTPPDATTVDEVVAEAFASLGNGPTWFVGDTLRAGAQMLGALPRNDAVNLLIAASEASMGAGGAAPDAPGS